MCVCVCVCVFVLAHAAERRGAGAAIHSGPRTYRGINNCETLCHTCCKLLAHTSDDQVLFEQLDLHHGGGELVKFSCLQLLQGILHNSPYYDLAVETIVQLHGVRILIVCLGASYVFSCDHFVPDYLRICVCCDICFDCALGPFTPYLHTWSGCQQGKPAARCPTCLHLQDAEKLKTNDIKTKTDPLLRSNMAMALEVMTHLVLGAPDSNAKAESSPASVHL